MMETVTTEFRENYRPFIEQIQNNDQKGASKQKKLCHTYGGAAGCGPIHALTFGVTLHTGFIHDSLPWFTAKTKTKTKLRHNFQKS